MARIDVLTRRPVGTLDRRVFGSFTEHLGRCIYGGVLDEGSPLSGQGGFRGDVLAAVRDLGVTNVRWPYEMYGDWQIGQLSAAEYVARARRWARALNMLDPGISLVSCGQTGLDDWDSVVIDGLASEVDWHSIHLYTGSDD